MLILADVFENFRSMSMKHYQLDPAQFYMAPALSSKAELKITGIELQLLTDIDRHLFIEEGIRGVAMISCRYARLTVT